VLPRRHPGVPHGPGHLRLPLAGGRRHRPQKACDKVVDKAKKLAAHLLEASEDDIEFADGTFSVKGSPDASKTIQELALAVFAAHDYPEDMEPTSTGRHLRPGELLLPARHAPVRRRGRHRDRPGRDPQLRRVDDVGKVINPQIVEGQVHGGLAQGIAQALYEGRSTTTTATCDRVLVDYLRAVRGGPAALRHRPHRDAGDHQPLGVKGVGEAGTIASTPAVVNAVVDALRPSASRRRDALHPRTCGERSEDARKGGAHDPRELRLRPGHLGRRGVAALAEHGDEAKVLAGGHSLLPLMKLRLAVPRGPGRHRPGRRAAGVREAATTWSSAPGPPTTTSCTTRWSASTAGCSPRPPRWSATPRSATAAPSAAPPPTATPPATCRRRAAALEATFVARARRAAEIAAADFFQGLPRDPWRPTRCSSRSASRSYDGSGAGLREVQPGRPGLGHRGRRWRSSGGQRRHRGGPDRADQHGHRCRCGPPRPSRPSPAPTARRRHRGGLPARGRRHQPAGDLNAQPDYRQHLARVLTPEPWPRAAG
jgi:hypothetical protein